jgi:choice-of-anchor B domain-containing protein
MFRANLTAVALLFLGVGAAGAQTRRDADTERALAGFGGAIALLGDQAFVGESQSGAAPGGIVHVYRRTGGSWQRSAGLTVEGLAAGDNFGSALAADGTTLLVGMRNASDSSRGGVRVFTRGQSGSWTAGGSLGTPAARSSFGAAVAINGDWAYVGAPNERPGGAVHLFRRSGSTWTAAGSLPAGELTPGDRFGSAIAIDGERVAVGAPGRNAQKGMVMVFRRGADGSWTQEGSMAGRRVPANAQLGLSIAFSGDQLWAGGPNANGFTGMVVGFTRNAAGEWSEGSTLAPFESGSSRFGLSLAMVGQELWIGAPFSDRREGRIFRAMMDADGGLTGMVKLGADSLKPGSQFGGQLIVAGATAMVGMPGDGGGEGSVIFMARNAQGNWGMHSLVYPAPDEFASVSGSEARCADGQIGEFGCSNTSLLSFTPISKLGGSRGTNLNDNWGWTDPTNDREYALVGRTDGTSFVDVTDPTNPRYLGDLPMTEGANANAWRDMKTYGNHVFIVADGSGPHGMQVFDLTRLRGVTTPQTFTADAHYDGIGSAHNIVINEESGFAYAVGVNSGGESCGGGLHMIDIHSPTNPVFAGCFSDPKTGNAGTGYSHDAQCVIYKGPDTAYQGHEICLGSNETAISVADVTDKKNPVAISNASYPDVAYAHQGWLTEDHRFYYLNDEGDESSGAGEAGKGTRTLVWDLTDLDDPILLKQHVGETKAIDHNLYVKGNRIYESNYTSGLRILDISDPTNPREVGYFDTYPADDATSFNGTWSNYPYFKSGTIIVTGIGEGLFLVRDRTQAVP